MRKHRIGFCAAFAALALVVGASLVGSPAQAAVPTSLPSGCALSATVPTDNNTNVWSTATLTCGTSRLLLVKAAVDVKVLMFWDNAYGGWSSWWGERGTSSTTTRTVSCNGMGTDVWRGRAAGEVDSSYSHETTSGTISLTC